MASGIELYEEGFEEAALPHLQEEASKETPPGLASLYYTAAAALRNKDAEGVKSVLTEEFDKSVTRDLVYQVVGSVLFDMGHVREGIEYMRLAVSHNPNSVQHARVLATRLENCGEEYRQEAADLFLHILEQDACDSRAWAGLGYLKMDSEEYGEAFECLKKALELDPADSIRNYCAGLALLKGGMPKEAIRYFETSIEVGFEHPENVYALLAECWHNLNCGELATRYLAQAIRENASSPDVQEAIRKIQR